MSHKVTTAHFEIYRRAQRIYPLEVSPSDGAENIFPNNVVKERQTEQPLTDESSTE